MNCVNRRCNAELPENAVYCHICGKKQAPEPRKYIKRANGSGSVYKLSDTRRRRPWVVAKNRTIIGYYETRGAALEVANKLIKMPISDRYNLSFAEVYKLWSSEHFRDIGEKGVEGYENAFNQFSALHNRKFRDLRTDNYQPIIDELIKKGRSHSTTNKLKQLASQMSKWAMREEIITTNYAQFIKLQENVKTEKPVFTPEDIAKLKSNGSEAAKLILILIFTGMRIGELFSMRTDSVYDTYCIGGEKTEAGKNRIIPIPTNIRGYIQYFVNYAEPDGLFISGFGGDHDAANFRRRYYYPLLEKLGIEKKPPHSTRHTYASMAVSAGVKPELLQKKLGHADYSTTSNIYVHADVDALVEAGELLNYGG